MWGYGVMPWFPWMWWMWLFPFSLVILVVVFVLRGMNDRRDEKQETSAPGVTAREILDQRYARGELGREEYLRMKDDIG